MKWISVQERLPEEGQKVLICVEWDGQRKCDTATYWPSKDDTATYWPSKDRAYPFRDGWGSGNGPSVKFWMPFPNPPEVM